MAAGEIAGVEWVEGQAMSWAREWAEWVREWAGLRLITNRMTRNARGVAALTAAAGLASEKWLGEECGRSSRRRRGTTQT